MMGMLATIGIEPGKPFHPPEKLKAAMEKGVVDTYYYMQKRANGWRCGAQQWISSRLPRWPLNCA
jgi:hypothetical protein